MWKCPICEVKMEMTTSQCSKCFFELQYFENIKGYSLDELLI